MRVEYSSLAKQSFSSLLKISRCIILPLLLLTFTQTIFKFLFLEIVHHFSKQHAWFLLFYNAFIKPSFLLVLLVFVEKAFKKSKIGGVNEFYRAFKRIYISYIMYYFGIAALLSIIGYNGSLLLYMILFLKLPFIEVSIYFKNFSLIRSVRESFELTQDKLLRYMMILLFIFLVVRVLLVRAISGIADMGSGLATSLVNESIVSFFTFMVYIYLACLYRSLGDR